MKKKDPDHCTRCGAERGSRHSWDCPGYRQNPDRRVYPHDCAPVTTSALEASIDDVEAREELKERLRKVDLKHPGASLAKILEE